MYGSGGYFFVTPYDSQTIGGAQTPDQHVSLGAQLFVVVASLVYGVLLSCDALHPIIVLDW